MWLIVMCWPVMAVGYLPDGCGKPRVESRDSLRKNTRLLADFSTDLRVCCIFFLLSNVLHQALVLMGCCGLDLPQFASQSWDVFQNLMFLFKPQKGCF